MLCGTMESYVFPIAQEVATVTFNLLGLGEPTATATIEHDTKCWSVGLLAW